MPNTCKNCLFWNPIYEDAIPETGTCDRISLKSFNHQNGFKSLSKIEFGRDFGCIHFTSKHSDLFNQLFEQTTKLNKLLYNI